MSHIKPHLRGIVFWLEKTRDKLDAAWRVATEEERAAILQPLGHALEIIIKETKDDLQRLEVGV